MTPQQQPTNPAGQPQGPAPGGPHEPAKPPAQDPRPGDNPQDHRAPGDKHPTPKLGAALSAPGGGPAEPVPPPTPPNPGPAPDGP